MNASWERKRKLDNWLAKHPWWMQFKAILYAGLVLSALNWGVYELTRYYQGYLQACS